MPGFGGLGRLRDRHRQDALEQRGSGLFCALLREQVTRENESGTGLLEVEPERGDAPHELGFLRLLDALEARREKLDERPRAPVALVEAFERGFDARVSGRERVQLLEVANGTLGVAREILGGHRRFPQKLELLGFFEARPGGARRRGRRAPASARPS